MDHKYIVLAFQGAKLYPKTGWHCGFKKIFLKKLLNSKLVGGLFSAVD